MRTARFYFDNLIGWLYWQWSELIDRQAWCLSLRERLRKQPEWLEWKNSQWRVTLGGEAVRVINPGKTWKEPSRLARWVIALLLLLSGCDVLEAKRLDAEAEVARARAAEVRQETAKTEAETAQILARQQAEEEERESLLAAEMQRSLLRQAELDRQALRRAAELPFWAMVIFVGFGLPLIVVGGLYVVFSFGRGRSGAPLHWYLVARAQRRGLLSNPPATIVALPTREQITIGSQTDDSNRDGDNIIRI